MIRRLRLEKYKGFRKFEVTFGRQALLIGPNNAGKSTIISAIKLCNTAAKLAMRVSARDSFREKGRTVRGWRLGAAPDDGFNHDNVHHEFEDVATRLDLEYTSGAILHITWPADDPPFFWITLAGRQIVTAAEAKEALIRVGVVPPLSPVDVDEKLLTPDYLAKSVDSRLSSKHFRNNLLQLRKSDSEAFSDLIDYLVENTDEVDSLEVEQVWADEALVVVRYLDRSSRVPKELTWAGDGLQIWLQILFHLWRTRDFDCILLDEPDIFLHPDLQRRLVRVLESTHRQVIYSSHASEVASESDSSSLVWIERSKARSRRIATDEELGLLSDGLGSSFNLSIARALKAKVALFVEGDDMKLVSILASALGTFALATEQRIAVTGIGGFSHWPSVESFGYLKASFLGSAVKVRLILDRDYRRLDEIVDLEERMASAGVEAHVWRKKELESYLLVPSAIARVMNLPLEDVEDLLTQLHEELRVGVLAHFTNERFKVKDRTEDPTTFYSRVTKEFEAAWRSPAERSNLCSAKDIITGLNRNARSAGGQVVSARKLASALYRNEIDEELADQLLRAEADLAIT